MYKEGCVLMLDVIDSRKMEIETRYNLQNRIQQLCNYLNKVLASELLSDLEISAGDSIEGYFVSPEIAFDVFRLFNTVLFPVKLRAGLAKGQVYSNYMANKPNTNFIDGTAFHLARYCIEEAKNSRRRFITELDSPTDKIITDLVNLGFRQENRMTPKQQALNCLQNILFAKINPKIFCDVKKYSVFKEAIQNLYFSLVSSPKKNIENIGNGDNQFFDYLIDESSKTQTKARENEIMADALAVSRQNIVKMIERSYADDIDLLFNDARELMRLCK